VRKVHNVFPPELRDMLIDESGCNNIDASRCNVIFFSTKGWRAEADKMGGSDYDGDQFMFINDAAIVNLFHRASRGMTSPPPKRTRRRRGSRRRRRRRVRPPARCLLRVRSSSACARAT
jgi:hypothetical protein